LVEITEIIVPLSVVEIIVLSGNVTVS